ncbi:hypothetical protein C6Y11_03705 [Lactiplantibacillus pentosus]|nr:hypothetical protein [Lactiplantibacillus pentosus]PRO81286.1 hypothetical protein C6Y11_03705 [Lactiplantibacillus pentosus]PRO92331.1 hypothetical protein C6Y12_05830 [Lactiplantibacillus pentosus]
MNHASSEFQKQPAEERWKQCELPQTCSSRLILSWLPGILGNGRSEIVNCLGRQKKRACVDEQ